MLVNCIVCDREMDIAPFNYAGICWKCVIRGWTFAKVEELYPERYKEVIKNIRKSKKEERG